MSKLNSRARLLTHRNNRTNRSTPPPPYSRLRLLAVALAALLQAGIRASVALARQGESKRQASRRNSSSTVTGLRSLACAVLVVGGTLGTAPAISQEQAGGRGNRDRVTHCPPGPDFFQPDYYSRPGRN